MAGSKMMDYTNIKQHMEVIGADDVRIGTVDRVEHGKIRLSRYDSGKGHHKGRYHFIDLDWSPMSKDRRFAYQRTQPLQLGWKKNNRSPAPLWTKWRGSAVINRNSFGTKWGDEAR
jgi:hypothetical protein